MSDEATDVEVLVVDAEVLYAGGGSGGLSERTAFEVAQEYPRSIDAFKKELYSLATMDQASAESMFYSLKRGNVIEGPSIRFAECILYAFGNLRVGAQIVDVGASELVAEGVGVDLQKNSWVSRRVTRRITNKTGGRYNADMIAVTSNAAISIAIRNIVLTMVPRPWYQGAYEAALAAAVGDEKTFKTRRMEWAKWWKEQGGSDEEYWDWLDVRGDEDVGGFELRRLTGLKNSIKEGHTTFQRELDVMKGAEIGEDEAEALDAKLTGAK